MSDIDTIRREIDGKYEAREAAIARSRSFHMFDESRDAIHANQVARDSFRDLTYAIADHWPTISQALADAEADRRKDAVAVCDDLLRAYSRLVNGTIMADSFAYEAMRIAKTAIEAALAAKEQNNG